MVFIGKVNNYMFRPIAAIFRLLQFCSKSAKYMSILRGDVEISLFQQNFNNLKMTAISRNM